MGSATQVAKRSRAWHSVWHGSQHQQSIEIIGEPHKQKLWVTCISTKIVFQVSHGAATSDINMPQIHPNTSNGIAFIVLPRGNFGNSRHLQQQRVGSWRDKDFTFHSKCIKWRRHGLFFPSLPSQQTPPLWLSRSTKGLAPCNFSQDITKHQKTESILQNRSQGSSDLSGMCHMPYPPVSGAPNLPWRHPASKMCQPPLG